MLTHRVRNEWLCEPPITLTVGEGSYAAALAFVLGSVLIDASALVFGCQENSGEPAPLVLRNLEKVVLVGGVGDSSADLLARHKDVWRWIEKLSPEGEQHDVAILFVLPLSSSSSLGKSLGVGLGLEKFDPESGHGIARMGDSLETLCRVLSAIRPCDLPPLRARQAGNIRHKAIRQLAVANDREELNQAARNVAACFAGEEYHLDMFCRPPSHRNGNHLRQWLRDAVTAGVTPESLKLIKTNLAEWIRTE